MTDIADVEQLAEGDHLAVLCTARADGTVQASVVSAGVTVDPVDAAPAVGAVVRGDSVKLRLLRRDGRATAVFRHGGRWASVSGHVRLVGPDDGEDLGIDVAALLRTVFRAAGGEHEDWDEFDRVMAEERRCAVFVLAERISGNATG